MKIPQLVQKIIDYYLYLVPWKARIKQLNIEYKGRYHYRSDNPSLVDKYTGFVYNWRETYLLDWQSKIIICSFELNPTIRSVWSVRTSLTNEVAKLPPRYFISNTEEQLKSLYF